MQNVGKLSEGLLSNTECVSVLRKNNYTAPPRRHLEPRELSWQWSVQKGPEVPKCKDLCVPKTCPKKGFFPRFKKCHIPVERKSCTPPKRKQSWKEFFSFLLPDSAAKPPLITCRKLQAQRRECCGNPLDCGAYCLRDNCCPPPKEWFGQAVIYAVPSTFPEPSVSAEPKPCAPPPPAEPASSLALKGICPEPKQELNMDEYAYKKAFSGINVCDEAKSKPLSFKCQNVCYKEPPKFDKRHKLTCGFSTEFKEVECPQTLLESDTRQDLPPLVCHTAQSTKPPSKEITVEEKKGSCERTTFLKPFKYGEKYPGMGNCRSIHTYRRSASDSMLPGKSFYTTSTRENRPTVPEPTTASLIQSKWLAHETPAFVQRVSYYQPSRSGMSLQSVLTRPISGFWKVDGMYVPPEYHTQKQWASHDLIDQYDVPDINPELLALAEETRKTVRYAEPKHKEEKKDPPDTLARRLSNEITQRMIQRARDGMEESTLKVNPPVPVMGRTKLSLLQRSRSPIDFSRATFTTDTALLARKKREDSSKKNTICSGCSGIREAEREEKNPTPKSFLDCKVRPAGRCRGPTRELKPGDPEPDNPYYRNKAKPYSICNKPRPHVKKEERPYKMPCEQKNKRKFHTSALVSSESAPGFTTLCDIMKTKGISLNNKVPNTRANAWDSHTPDSYLEKDMKGYDSVPDLGKVRKDEVKPFSMKDTLRNVKPTFPKISSNSAFDTTDSSTEQSSKMNDWGFSPEPHYDKDKTEMISDESKTKTEKPEAKTSGIKIETSAVNIWENPKVSSNNSFKKEENCSEGTVDTASQSNFNKPYYSKSEAEHRNTISWSQSPSNSFSSTMSRSDSKPTRFSVLFNSMSKEKQKSKEFDSTKREKSANKMFLNQNALD